MTRLTGTDAWGLMEAYNAVYAPQEITEEQIWEEVELWVNSLVEEGYDLSEYTWDEMRELYEAKVDDVEDKKLEKRGVDPVTRIMVKKASRSNRNARKFTPRTKTQVKLAHRRSEVENDDQEVRGARKTGESSTQYEGVDLYDVVLTHLIDEGYADTAEDAVVIMTNMSDNWKESIILDERNRGEQGMNDAQVRYRRDTRDFGHIPGGISGGVRVGGQKRKDHDDQRGKKKRRGRVLPHMRGPNDNVTNYHAVRGKD